MSTPAKDFICRKRANEPLSASSITSNSASRSPKTKQVLLHDWWLTKAGSDSHGKRLGIGGVPSKEDQSIRSIRCFSSAHIVKRHNGVTLETIDGVTVLVHGYLNRFRTLQNGFSHEVCEHFQIGFPYYWEEYDAVYVDEEPTQFSSTPGDQGTNRSSEETIFDDILQKNHDYAPTVEIVDSIFTPDEALMSHKKIKGGQKRRGEGNVGDVECSGGPLTRSRARSLQTDVRGGIF